MADAQIQLMDLPAAEPMVGEPAGTGSSGSTDRRSSKTIGPGDIVEVDKKGRRFHALVVELEQGSNGRFALSVRPLDSRISYRQATVREIVGVWRKARTRAA